MASSRSGDRCSSFVFPGKEVDGDGGGREGGGESARSASRCSTMVRGGWCGREARLGGERRRNEAQARRWTKSSGGILLSSKGVYTLDSSA